MIDLNYHPKSQPKGLEPEEIACAIVAILIWTAILILFVRAL